MASTYRGLFLFLETFCHVSWSHWPHTHLVSLLHFWLHLLSFHHGLFLLHPVSSHGAHGWAFVSSYLLLWPCELVFSFPPLITVFSPKILKYTFLSHTSLLSSKAECMCIFTGPYNHSWMSQIQFALTESPSHSPTHSPNKLQTEYVVWSETWTSEWHS